MATITKTVMKWKDTVTAFRRARHETTSKVVGETVALIEAAVPAFRLATMSYDDRARRVSVRSLVERCAREAAPHSDVAGLRRYLDEHPKRCKPMLGGLHTLVEKVRATPGWHTAPPADEDAVLLSMSDDDKVQGRIDNQLTRAGANPVTALALAFEIAAEKWPEAFGSVDLEMEGQEVADANQQVTELEAALREDPELLGALAVHYGAPADAREIMRAAARAR